MSTWAKPGAKCVCIRKSRWISATAMEAIEAGPKFNEVLTIAVVVPSELFGPGLHFVEYPLDAEGWLPVYPLREFQPLVSQGRDVAAFASLLEAEKADA